MKRRRKTRKQINERRRNIRTLRKAAKLHNALLADPRTAVQHRKNLLALSEEGQWVTEQTNKIVGEFRRKQACRWCGMTHGPKCPDVKAIEYDMNGMVKRVEFFDRNEKARVEAVAAWAPPEDE